MNPIDVDNQRGSMSNEVVGEPDWVYDAPGKRVLSQLRFELSVANTSLIRMVAVSAVTVEVVPNTPRS